MAVTGGGTTAPKPPPKVVAPVPKPAPAPKVYWFQGKAYYSITSYQYAVDTYNKQVAAAKAAAAKAAAPKVAAPVPKPAPAPAPAVKPPPPSQSVQEKAAAAAAAKAAAAKAEAAAAAAALARKKAAAVATAKAQADAAAKEKAAMEARRKAALAAQAVQEKVAAEQAAAKAAAAKAAQLQALELERRKAAAIATAKAQALARVEADEKRRQELIKQAAADLAEADRLQKMRRDAAIADARAKAYEAVQREASRIRGLQAQGALNESIASRGDAQREADQMEEKMKAPANDRYRAEYMPDMPNLSVKARSVLVTRANQTGDYELLLKILEGQTRKTGGRYVDPVLWKTVEDKWIKPILSIGDRLVVLNNQANDLAGAGNIDAAIAIMQSAEFQKLLDQFLKYVGTPEKPGPMVSVFARVAAISEARMAVWIATLKGAQATANPAEVERMYQQALAEHEDERITVWKPSFDPVTGLPDGKGTYKTVYGIDAWMEQREQEHKRLVAAQKLSQQNWIRLSQKEGYTNAHFDAQGRFQYTDPSKQQLLDQLSQWLPAKWMPNEDGVPQAIANLYRDAQTTTRDMYGKTVNVGVAGSQPHAAELSMMMKDYMRAVSIAYDAHHKALRESYGLSDYRNDDGQGVQYFNKETQRYESHHVPGFLGNQGALNYGMSKNQWMARVAASVGYEWNPIAEMTVGPLGAIPDALALVSASIVGGIRNLAAWTGLHQTPYYGLDKPSDMRGILEIPFLWSLKSDGSFGAHGYAGSRADPDAEKNQYIFKKAQERAVQTTNPALLAEAVRQYGTGWVEGNLGWILEGLADPTIGASLVPGLRGARFALGTRAAGDSATDLLRRFYQMIGPESFRGRSLGGFGVKKGQAEWAKFNTLRNANLSYRDMERILNDEVLGGEAEWLRLYNAAKSGDEAAVKATTLGRLLAEGKQWQPGQLLRMVEQTQPDMLKLKGINPNQMAEDLARFEDARAGRLQAEGHVDDAGFAKKNPEELDSSLAALERHGGQRVQALREKPPAAPAKAPVEDLQRKHDTIVSRQGAVKKKIEYEQGRITTQENRAATRSALLAEKRALQKTLGNTLRVVKNKRFIARTSAKITRIDAKLSAMTMASTRKLLKKNLTLAKESLARAKSPMAKKTAQRRIDDISQQLADTRKGVVAEARANIEALRNQGRALEAERLRAYEDIHGNARAANRPTSAAKPPAPGQTTIFGHMRSANQRRHLDQLDDITKKNLELREKAARAADALESGIAAGNPRQIHTLRVQFEEAMAKIDAGVGIPKRDRRGNPIRDEAGEIVYDTVPYHDTYRISPEGEVVVDQHGIISRLFQAASKYRDLPAAVDSSWRPDQIAVAQIKADWAMITKKLRKANAAARNAVPGSAAQREAQALAADLRHALVGLNMERDIVEFGRASWQRLSRVNRHRLRKAVSERQVGYIAQNEADISVEVARDLRATLENAVVREAREFGPQDSQIYGEVQRIAFNRNINPKAPGMDALIEVVGHANISYGDAYEMVRRMMRSPGGERLFSPAYGHIRETLAGWMNDAILHQKGIIVETAQEADFRVKRALDAKDLADDRVAGAERIVAERKVIEQRAKTRYNNVYANEVAFKKWARWVWNRVYKLRDEVKPKDDGPGSLDLDIAAARQELDYAEKQFNRYAAPSGEMRAQTPAMKKRAETRYRKYEMDMVVARANVERLLDARRDARQTLSELTEEGLELNAKIDAAQIESKAKKASWKRMQERTAEKQEALDFAKNLQIIASREWNAQRKIKSVTRRGNEFVWTTRGTTPSGKKVKTKVTSNTGHGVGDLGELPRPVTGTSRNRMRSFAVFLEEEHLRDGRAVRTQADHDRINQKITKALHEILGRAKRRGAVHPGERRVLSDEEINLRLEETNAKITGMKRTLAQLETIAKSDKTKPEVVASTLKKIKDLRAKIEKAEKEFAEEQKLTREEIRDREREVIRRLMHQDIDGQIIWLKKRLLAAEGMTMHEYDELRSVFAQPMVRANSTRGFIKRGTTEAARNGTDLLDEVALQRIKRRDVEVSRDYVDFAMRQQERTPGMNQESITRLYEEKKIRSDLRAPTKRSISRYQHDSLRNAFESQSKLKYDSPGVPAYLQRAPDGTSLPLHNASAAREWLVKHGFWSNRTGDDIARGGRVWHIEEEADWYRAFFGEAPIWTDETILGVLLHHQGALQAFFKSVGMYDGNFEDIITGRSGNLNLYTAKSRQKALAYGATDEVTGVELPRQRTADELRDYMRQRFGKLVFDEKTERLTAAPWLMRADREYLIWFEKMTSKWGRRDFAFDMKLIRDYLPEDLRAVLFEGGSLSEAGLQFDKNLLTPREMEALRNAANKAMERRIDRMHKEMPFDPDPQLWLGQERLLFAYDITRELMMDPGWKSFGKSMPARALLLAWGKFFRLLVSFTVAFPLLNLAESYGWKRVLLSLFYNDMRFVGHHSTNMMDFEINGVPVRITEAEGAQKLGLNAQHADIESSDIYGLSEAKAQFWGRSGDRYLPLNVRITSGLEDLVNFPLFASKYGEDALRLDFYRSVAVKTYKDLRGLGYGHEMAVTLAREEGKRMVKRFFATIGDNPGMQILNNLIPFFSYNFNNKILALKMVAEHPAILVWAERIRAAVERGNREQWEEDHPGVPFPEGAAASWFWIEIDGTMYQIDMASMSDWTRAMASLSSEKDAIEWWTEFIRIPHPSQNALIALITGGVTPWGKPGSWRELLPWADLLLWMQGQDYSDPRDKRDVIQMWSQILFFKKFGSITPLEVMQQIYFGMKARDPDAAASYLRRHPDLETYFEFLRKDAKEKGKLPRSQIGIKPTTTTSWWDIFAEQDEKLGTNQLSEYDKAYAKWQNLEGSLDADILKYAHQPWSQEYRDAKERARITREMFLSMNPILARAWGLGMSPSDFSRFHLGFLVDQQMDAWFNWPKPKRADFDTDLEYQRARVEMYENQRNYLAAHPALVNALFQNKSAIENAWHEQELHWSEILEFQARLKVLALTEELKGENMNRDLLNDLYDVIDDLGTMLDMPRYKDLFPDVNRGSVSEEIDARGVIRSLGGSLLSGVAKVPGFYEIYTKTLTPAEKQQYDLDRWYYDRLDEISDASTDGLDWFKKMLADPKFRDEYFKRNPEKKIKYEVGQEYMRWIGSWAGYLKKGQFANAQATWDQMPAWVKERYFANNPNSKMRDGMGGGGTAVQFNGRWFKSPESRDRYIKFQKFLAENPGAVQYKGKWFKSAETRDNYIKYIEGGTASDGSTSTAVQYKGKWFKSAESRDRYIKYIENGDGSGSGGTSSAVQYKGRWFKSAESRDRYIKFIENGDPGTAVQYKGKWFKSPESRDRYIKFVEGGEASGPGNGAVQYKGRWFKSTASRDRYIKFIETDFADHAEVGIETGQPQQPDGPPPGGGASQGQQYFAQISKWVELLKAKDFEGADGHFRAMPSWMRERYFSNHPDQRARLELDSAALRMGADYFLATGDDKLRVLQQNPELRQWLADNGGNEAAMRGLITEIYNSIPSTEPWLKRTFRLAHPEIFSVEAIGERRYQKVVDDLMEHPEMLPFYEKALAMQSSTYQEQLKMSKTPPKPVTMERKKRMRKRHRRRAARLHSGWTLHQDLRLGR